MLFLELLVIANIEKETHPFSKAQYYQSYLISIVWRPGLALGKFFQDWYFYSDVHIDWVRDMES